MDIVPVTKDQLQTVKSIMRFYDHRSRRCSSLTLYSGNPLKGYYFNNENQDTSDNEINIRKVDIVRHNCQN